MKVYTLKKTQFLPITLAEAWSFFSTPENLSKITPEHMGLQIRYMSGGVKMYSGQIIRYTVRILPYFAVDWVTEISQVNEPNYFVDEQRFGPYALWHHQHHFKEVAGGVEMTDEVNYAIPLGILGRLAHWLFVGREVNTIFNHRYAVLEKYFAQESNESVHKIA